MHFQQLMFSELFIFYIVHFSNWEKYEKYSIFLRVPKSHKKTHPYTHIQKKGKNKEV